MKKIILLILFPLTILAQIKVQNLPTTTTGATGDFLIKDKAAGGAGGTQKISVANFITTYFPSYPTGSGTINFIPKWTGTSTLGNSFAYFDTDTLIIPSTKHIRFSGLFRYNGSTPTNGYVLTTDGSGNATWQAGSGGWGLSGNASTVDGTNFIGTTDNIPFTIRVNNISAARLDYANKNFFIGTSGGLTASSIKNNSLGYEALKSITSGYHSNGIGYSALYSLLGGGNSNAVGSEALYSQTSSTANNAFGYFALHDVTTSGSNSAFGDGGLRLTTGNYNTAIGALAGNINVTGIENTYLGASANPSASNFNNSTAIGYGASITASNQIKLGNASVTEVGFRGALMPYYSAAYQAGTAGEVLTSQGAGVAPQWATGSSGTVTSIATGNGITGGTITTTGTLGLAGATGDIGSFSASNTYSAIVAVSAGSYLRSNGTSTLPIYSTLKLPNSATANYIPYATSTNTWGESANLQFDGSKLGVNMTPSNVFDVTQNQNGASTMQITNNTSGTSAQSRIIAANSVGDVSQFGVFSSASTAVGAIASRYSYFYGSSSLVLWGAANLIFSTGVGAAAVGNFNSSGRLFVGGSTSATGLLHIAAGTATASTSPLKFTSGTSLTSAEAGAMEFTTDNYFLTSTTSTIRKTINDLAVRSISALRTLDGSDELVNITSGTFTVTLPTAVGYTKQYIIKNSGTGVITLATTSSQTIDGALTLILGVQYESITLRSDGANWIVI